LGHGGAAAIPGVLFFKDLHVFFRQHARKISPYIKWLKIFRRELLAALTPWVHPGFSLGGKLTQRGRGENAFGAPSG